MVTNLAIEEVNGEREREMEGWIRAEYYDYDFVTERKYGDGQERKRTRERGINEGINGERKGKW